MAPEPIILLNFVVAHWPMCQSKTISHSLDYCITISAQLVRYTAGTMADTQPNPDISTGSSGMAAPNMDQFPPMAVVADWGSDYRMVELGRMKPYCLQLDASLVEVMDSPPPPAHAWTPGIVADIIRTILPDLNEAAIAGDGIAILFFGRKAFREGLLPQQAEEYATRLARQIEWVEQLVLLTATPLLLSEGRQTLAHYRAMVRMNQ